MNLKKLERYLRVNMFGTGPRFIKKEFTGPQSHKRLRKTGLVIIPTARTDSNVTSKKVKFKTKIESDIWMENATQENQVPKYEYRYLRALNSVESGGGPSV